MSVCALQAESLHLRVKVKVGGGVLYPIDWRKVRHVGIFILESKGYWTHPKVFVLHKFANGFITVQREYTQVYLTLD